MSKNLHESLLNLYLSGDIFALLQIYLRYYKYTANV